MKRYLSVISSFFRISLIQNLEYRLNFFVWAFVSVFWAGMFLLSVELIFGQITTIAGWTKNEVLIMASIHVLFSGIMFIFVTPSLSQLPKLINQGSFDFYLSKPVSTRFLLTFSKFESDQYIRTFILIYALFYFLSAAGITPGILNWLSFISLFVLGLFIFYNIFFIIFTLSIWLVDVHNFDWFVNEILDAGRFPVQIFKGGFQLLFFYVIPLGFVATFPTQALLGKADSSVIIYAVFTAVGLFIFSQWFWNFALKHYSSASS